MRPRLDRLEVALLAALCAAAQPAAAAFSRDRVVLLVQNRSSNGAADAELSPVVAGLLAAKGYEVVPAPEVTSALEAAHIPAGADLAPEAAAQLRQALRAEAVVTVIISFFLGGQERAVGPRANPAFGLRARVVGASGAIWSNSLGWIADDAPAPAAGFRKAQPKPTAVAVERLLWSMPRGRRDPAAAQQVIEEAVVVSPVPATRFVAPVERRREFSGVAHFPMRMDARTKAE